MKIHEEFPEQKNNLEKLRDSLKFPSLKRAINFLLLSNVKIGNASNSI